MNFSIREFLLRLDPYAVLLLLVVAAITVRLARQVPFDPPLRERFHRWNWGDLLRNGLALQVDPQELAHYAYENQAVVWEGDLPQSLGGTTGTGSLTDESKDGESATSDGQTVDDAGTYCCAICGAMMDNSDEIFCPDCLIEHFVDAEELAHYGYEDQTVSGDDLPQDAGDNTSGIGSQHSLPMDEPMDPQHQDPADENKSDEEGPIGGFGDHDMYSCAICGIVMDSGEDMFCEECLNEHFGEF